MTPCRTPRTCVAWSIARAACMCVLQCVAVCCSVLQWFKGCQGARLRVVNNVLVLHGRWHALYGCVCCSMLHCVADVTAYCSVLQRVMGTNGACLLAAHHISALRARWHALQCKSVAACCSMLQHVAARCSVCWMPYGTR